MAHFMVRHLISRFLCDTATDVFYGLRSPVVVRSVNQTGGLSSQTASSGQQSHVQQQFIPTVSTSVMLPSSSALNGAAWSAFVAAGNQTATATASTATANEQHNRLPSLATGQPAGWPSVAPASQGPPGQTHALTASTPVTGTIPILQQNVLDGALAPPLSGPLPAVGPTPVGTTSDPNAWALQIQLMQALVQSKASPEQINQVLATLGFPQPPPPPPPVSVPPQATITPQIGSNGNHPPEMNDQNGFRDRSNERRRRRSRSPDHKRRRYSLPNRRDSPTYGVYDPAAAQNENNHVQEHDRRGRGKGGKGHRNDNRQRTPLPVQHNRPISPANVPVAIEPRWIDYDSTIPKDHIKGMPYRQTSNIRTLTLAFQFSAGRSS